MENKLFNLSIPVTNCHSACKNLEKLFKNARNNEKTHSETGCDNVSSIDNNTNVDLKERKCEISFGRLKEAKVSRFYPLLARS